jgi:hypothetical protein
MKEYLKQSLSSSSKSRVYEIIGPYTKTEIKEQVKAFTGQYPLKVTSLNRRSIKLFRVFLKPSQETIFNLKLNVLLNGIIEEKFENLQDKYYNLE